MKNFVYIVLLCITNFTTQAQVKSLQFTNQEKELIKSGNKNEPMRVLQTTNSDDYKFLVRKTDSVNFFDENLKFLANRMLVTVQDPKSKGVGIAAPQVGIGRKAFWVKRFDKENAPFEFFVNPKIIWYSDIKRLGKEGCLSIPNESGMVYRSLLIRITYFDLQGNEHDEVIEGFTAIICQHEFDHLEGVLYPMQIEKSLNLIYKNAIDKNDLYYLKKE